MLSVQKTFLTVVAAMALISGCDCGPEQEPDLILSLSSETAFRVDTLYGVGATGTLPIATKIRHPSDTQFQTRLPIDLRNDSTSYVVGISGRRERLTIYYKRHFYPRKYCGQIFELREPIGQKAQTTKGIVQAVIYQPNRFNFLNYTDETRIWLRIKL